jgi:hypothetical protein
VSAANKTPTKRKTSKVAAGKDRKRRRPRQLETASVAEAILNIKNEAVEEDENNSEQFVLNHRDYSLVHHF